jgi:hypothetical protein
MAPIIGIGIGINRQYRIVAGGGGGGPARTTDSVTVGTPSGFDLPLTIESDGEVGDTVYYVISDVATTEAETLAGTIPGGNGVAGSFAFGASSVTIPSGLPYATDWLITVCVSAGGGGTVATSGTFTADTTAPVVTLEVFTDSGAEGIDFEFQTDEAVSYRVSAWADGTVPSAADLEAGSGTGFISSTTGTTAAGVLETGTLATGDGVIVPGLWVQDSLGNEYTEVYADVTVAAADIRTTDSGVIYWFASDDTTRSGTDVTAINDKRGGFDLDTKPAAFSFIQQATGSDPLVFAATRVLQTSTRASGNSKMMTHMDGGAGREMRVFLVVDAADFGTAAAVHFSESDTNAVNNSAFFGGYRSGSNIVFGGQMRSAAGNALSSTATTTGANYTTTGLCIMEWKITQSTWDIYLNGVDQGGGAVTPANFPGTQAVRTTLGALASDTAIVVGSSAIGDFREIYVTATADDTTANSIRSAIAAQYGITI